jgi:hypothetical protein
VAKFPVFALSYCSGEKIYHHRHEYPYKKPNVERIRLAKFDPYYRNCNESGGQQKMRRQTYQRGHALKLQ